MKVSTKTIEILTSMITGDAYDYYQSGPELVEFFNKFGFDDIYGSGFPSRRDYAKEKLIELNKQKRINEVLKLHFNPINFIEREELLRTTIDKLNRYLNFDDFELEIKNKTVIIKSLKNCDLEINNIYKIDNEYINEHFVKCDTKVQTGDYSGAITSARTLLETILLYIYKEISKQDYNFKGDLPKLYKEVTKSLNLAIDSKTQERFKQILSGFISIINGLSGISNKIGDRHGKILIKYKAEKHHAVLVINSSKTITEFLFSSYEKQYKKNILILN